MATHLRNPLTAKTTIYPETEIGMQQGQQVPFRVTKTVYKRVGHTMLPFTEDNQVFSNPAVHPDTHGTSIRKNDQRKRRTRQRQTGFYAR